MRSRPLILVSLLLAAFAIKLDATIVNVALPTLVRELHAGPLPAPGRSPTAAPGEWE